MAVVVIERQKRGFRRFVDNFFYKNIFFVRNPIYICNR